MDSETLFFISLQVDFVSKDRNLMIRNNKEFNVKINGVDNEEKLPKRSFL